MAVVLGTGMKVPAGVPAALNGPWQLEQLTAALLIVVWTLGVGALAAVFVARAWLQVK